MILTLTELEDGILLAGTDGNGIAVLEERKGQPDADPGRMD